jgi:ribosomal-protein-alanine N-acetyltransferase
MTAPPTLHTKRLTLRPITADDANALHEMFSDAESMRFWDRPPTRDLTETRTRLNWSLTSPPEGHAMFAMVRRADGKMIGIVNYFARQPWNQRLEIGYMVHRSVWRTGVMSEALPPFLDYCFDGLQSHRIEATIEPDNAASRGIAASMGFVCEGGPMRDRLRNGDSYRSLLMYGLLEPDWRKIRAGMRT